MRKTRKNQVKESFGTKRFRYGIILTLFSVVALIMIHLSEAPARLRVDSIDSDPRYNPKTWEKKSESEQRELSREMMSARNNLKQIVFGNTLFTISLTLGLFLTIISFAPPLRSKADKVMEEFDSTKED